IHEFSVVRHYASDLRGRCFMLDFEPNHLGGFGGGVRLSDRTRARLFRKFYPEFASLSWDTVRKARRFYLVAASLRGQNRLEYPGFVAGSLGIGLYDLRSERQEDERDRAFSQT